MWLISHPSNKWTSEDRNKGAAVAYVKPNSWKSEKDSFAAIMYNARPLTLQWSWWSQDLRPLERGVEEWSKQPSIQADQEH